MSAINALVTTALDAIYLSNPTFLFVTNRSDVETELQDALNLVIPPEVSLSAVKPDYEAIYLQIAQALQDKPLWRDQVPTQVGQTLIRNIASGITYLHNAIMRATQITFLSPGTPKSSVYQVISNFGVNPRRKIPAKLPVNLTVPDHQNSFIITKYTNFVINGTNYFNREDIVYTEFDLLKSVNVVQGTKFSQSGLADGIPYERIEIGYENWMISDEDVYVKVNGVYWTRANYLPWNAKKLDNIYFVKTLDTGNIEIMFGNNIFGKQLRSEDEVEVIWFETSGKSADSIPIATAFNAFNTDNAPITGVTTGSIFGMDDELDTEFYINAGPNMRSSEHGAVKRRDYPTVACKYPNVRDALFRGQSQIAPGKRNYMNVVEATLLQDSKIPVSGIERERFVNYLTDNSIWQLEYIRRDPFIINIDISAKLHCGDAAVLNMLKAAKETAIGNNFNKPRLGAIGYSLFKSDIIQAIEGNPVEYITELEIKYSDGFDSSNMPPGTGFDAEGNIIADYISYVNIKNVDFTTVYTPRRSNSGRREFTIGQS